jgi:hypothetical protein
MGSSAPDMVEVCDDEEYTMLMQSYYIAKILVQRYCVAEEDGN